MDAYVSIKISKMPAVDLVPKLVEVVVDTNYYLPTMFTIRIRDTQQSIPGLFDDIDNMIRFSIGASIDLTIYNTPEKFSIPIMNTLVKGEITSIEPIFEKGQMDLRIRGYDRGHRLTRGKMTRTYGFGSPVGPGITDADIVNSIAMNYGLVPIVDMAKLQTVRYPYVMQYNQNDWDFLWARAERLGYQLYVYDRMLYFTSGDAARQVVPPLTLEFGENLSRFEPVLDSMGQAASTEAFGWDPTLKMKVMGASLVETSLRRSLAPANLIPANVTVKTAFNSKAKWTIIDPAIRTIPEAQMMALAQFNKISSQYLRASGELDSGDPNLVAGSTVLISAVGARFTGNYFITEARHIVRDGKYRVLFKASGQKPTTMRSLILGADGVSKMNKMSGVVTAIVTSNVDPQNLGRIQVKYPWLPRYNGAELSSSWARLAVSGGGKDRGVLFIPEVDDEVLVAFENGDMNFPYIVGVLYSMRDRPPMGDKPLINPGTKKVVERVITSRSGHQIIFDDSDGMEKIIIRDKTKKNTITINSQTNAMELKSFGDFTIDAGGKLMIKSKGEMKISSTATLDMDAKTEMNLAAQTKVQLKAGVSQLALQTAGAELKGTKVDVTASTQLALKGTAMVQIQGGIVKIN